MGKIIKKEIINGVTIALLQVSNNRFSVTYFHNENVLNQFRTYVHSKKDYYSQYHSDGSTCSETEKQANERYEMMIHLIKSNQIRIKIKQTTLL